MRVRTRIAPSPTGDPHIGNFYTTLVNYVFAKKHGGDFILRIEDTDRARFVEGAEEKIRQALDWLGIVPSEGPEIGGSFGPYRQSERLYLYRQQSEELVDKGFAYYCFCSPDRLSALRKDLQSKGLPPKYDKNCYSLSAEEVAEKVGAGEPHVIRLNVPQEGETRFTDLIRGEIVFQNREIDDQVLLKSDGYPTYHLAVVVDDHFMEISHVIRAEEWISSTPKHVLLYEAFGWPLPQFAHLPLLRNPDKSKLSKRKNPVSVLWYKEQGFLPQTLVNYLALMGWAHPEEKEIFGIEEFVEKFDLESVKTSAPIFDLTKLEWMNGEYIRKLEAESLKKEIKNYLEEYRGIELDGKVLERVIPLVKERIKKLSEFWEMAGFLFEDPPLPKLDSELAKRQSLDSARDLRQVTDWKAENLEKAIRQMAQENNWKAPDLFMTLRIAITGSTVSPPLFESMEVLGRQKTLERLQSAANSN